MVAAQASDRWLVEVAHGPDAGRRWGLGVGRSITIGRAEICDRTISGHHLSIGTEWSTGHRPDQAQHRPDQAQPRARPLIRNLSSTNPALLSAPDGPFDVTIPEPGLWTPAPTCQVRIGATTIVVRRTAGSRVQGQTARRRPEQRRAPIRIDRPPLPPIDSSGTDPITVPSVSTTRQPPRLSIAALVLPVLTGLVLALVINPMLAVMAAMSPVLMLGSWIEEKRRARIEKAKGLRSTAEQLQTFERALGQSIRWCTDDLIRRFPTLAELGGFADDADLRLWERRRDHPDAGEVVLGLGTREAGIRLGRTPGVASHARAEDLLSLHRYLLDVPVTIALGPGRTVGVVGTHELAAALVRSMILQTAVMHGPADVRLALFADPTLSTEWCWLATLPHVRTGCDPLMSCSATTVRPVLGDLERSPVWTVMIIDGADMANHPSIRTIVASPPPWLTIIVVAQRIDQIPQRASATIDLQSETAQLVQNPSTPSHVPGTPVIISGASRSRAQRIGEALANCHDGALVDDGSALPPQVRLAELLMINPTDAPPAQGASEEETQWDRLLTSAWSFDDGRLVAPIGVAGTDQVVVDLVADGPHALIAGTTGSGKSEMLRTLVSSLACRHSPERLNFVLIDYKGGAAFTGLEALPHTVGFVTDLDDGLGSRALTCLDAELRRREQMLNDAGADDITSYPHGAAGNEPLPRLIVVIDEFATMLAELPDFVSALISIAQRGRSLGVHLVLATQRPAGAVNDSIRANTNLRLCLRVQTTADSSDVIGSPRSAALDRRFPGRAVLRTGPDEFVTMQTASCTLPRLNNHGLTSPSRHSWADLTDAQLAFRAPTEEIRPQPPSHSANGGPERLTDLEHIVRSAARVFRSMNRRPPRKPWPEPLPPHLPLVISDDGIAHVGLVDRPEQQLRHRLDIATFRSNVILFGAAGSGSSLALGAIACALAAASTADALHLYLVDHGAGVFGGLESIPNVGARIGGNEPERLDRLGRVLTDMIEARRAGSSQAARPHVVVCIDDWAAVRAANDDVLGTALERWYRIFADGPAVGVSAVITADRAQAVPGSALAAFATRFAFRLNDPLDDAMLGIGRSSPPRCHSGRAIDLRDGSLVQFAEIDLDKPPLPATQWRPVSAHGQPQPIELLAQSIRAHTVWELAADQQATERHHQRPPTVTHGLKLTIGIGDTDLGLVGWNLQQGEHLLVTGPSGSGKTNALAVIAVAARSAKPNISIVVCAGDRSALSATLQSLDVTHVAVFDPADIAGIHAAHTVAGPGTLVLVDDAEMCDDTAGSLSRFITVRHRDVWIVAAGRADAFRSSYGHWTVPLRRSRKGLALRPHLEQDGELWATQLPRRQVRGGGRAAVSMPPGRGYLVDDGRTELVQIGSISPIDDGFQGVTTERIAS